MGADAQREVGRAPGYSFLPPSNFLGLAPEDSAYETSRALILPIPYDATTSYKGGAKDGPRAILEASAQIELYDVELDAEPALEWGVHTLPALAPDLRSAEATIESIAAAVIDLPCREKLLCVLGGEHSISVGVARGLYSHFGEFVTVQLDAHADLRDEYHETPYSHACAARRILDLGGEVIQFGIRSLDRTEADFLKENPAKVTAHLASVMHRDRSYLTALIEKIKGKQVFLTIDLDAFDPSVIPATGTPEPGGLLWYDVLEIVQTVARESTVIAFDVVELAPIPGLHAPDFTAAKLVYKVLTAVLGKE
ncbi:agmatinase [Capsulimonas corticalis]|uniref:Agmatinase n=1 Tax=Capsulimonas corticalis TaxID=2219043 RepID=A0A402CV58_9BACT|nr:agmatinase [Capsulimonas corticalis]BDI30298.1 agmatinase [Capsulimonas corticalis]